MFSSTLESDKAYLNALFCPLNSRPLLTCKANRTGGQNDESNNELSKVVIRAVKIGCPGTASMENVVGMLLKKNRSHLQHIIASLLMLNYHVRLASKFLI
jgi:site-specific DNA-cytosine methylase